MIRARWSLRFFLVLFSLLGGAACPHPKVQPAPDFSALDTLLSQGEERRLEAISLVKDSASFSHVVSLLKGVEEPGRPSAMAWGAHHALIALGEPSLLALQKKEPETPMERFTASRIARHLGLEAPPLSAFGTAFCGSLRAPEQITLRYETGKEEVEGRVSFVLQGNGQARLIVKHTIKPILSRSFTLSPIELEFLLEKACASYFWESFPTRSRGADGEDAVSFSIEVGSINGQDPQTQSISLWGEEWRRGPTERLAKLLDATVARGKQTSLLLP